MPCSSSICEIWLSESGLAGSSAATIWRISARTAVLDAVAFDVTAAPLRETSDYLKSEVAKWAKVVRETGAKVD